MRADATPVRSGGSLIASLSEQVQPKVLASPIQGLKLSSCLYSFTVVADPTFATSMSARTAPSTPCPVTRVRLHARLPKKAPRNTLYAAPQLLPGRMWNSIAGERTGVCLPIRSTQGRTPCWRSCRGIQGQDVYLVGYLAGVYTGWIPCTSYCATVHVAPVATAAACWVCDDGAQGDLWQMLPKYTFHCKFSAPDRGCTGALYRRL